MIEIYVPSREERDAEEEYKKTKSYLSRIDRLIAKTLAKDDFNPNELDKLLKLRDKIKKGSNSPLT